MIVKVPSSFLPGTLSSGDIRLFDASMRSSERSLLDLGLVLLMALLFPQLIRLCFSQPIQQDSER